MTNTKTHRILKSDGTLEIERSSLANARIYVRVVLAEGYREPGIDYTLEEARNGLWVSLGQV